MGDLGDLPEIEFSDDPKVAAIQQQIEEITETDLADSLKMLQICDQCKDSAVKALVRVSFTVLNETNECCCGTFHDYFQEYQKTMNVVVVHFTTISKCIRKLLCCVRHHAKQTKSEKNVCLRNIFQV